MDDYNPRTRYEHYYVRMARLEGRGELQKRYPDDILYGKPCLLWKLLEQCNGSY